MNTRRAVSLFALTLIAVFPAVGLSQVYSWKDADGKIHYGDRPPGAQQSDSRKLAAPPAATADVEAARKANVEKQLTEREKQQKDKESAAKTQEAQAATKEREEGCRQAKANLAAIESGQVRYTLDAQGERVALDGAVRNAELARAQKNVDSWCKPAKPAK
jgi:hypothetical protein